VVLSLVLTLEPMQAPGAVVALVLVTRIQQAIEAGDEIPMLLVEEEVDSLLCRRAVVKLDCGEG
jgi:hypothetical protein